MSELALDTAGDRHWRERAHRPDVPARLRVFDEFLTYLERSDVEVDAPNPIDDVTVMAYRNMREAGSRVERLFRTAHQLMDDALTSGHEVKPRGRGDSWYSELTQPSWADTLGDDSLLKWFNVEFLVSPHDSWRQDGYGQPAFGAGLSFSYRGRSKVPPVLDAELSPWARELQQDGITVGITGDGHSRCFKTLYLAEVMSMATNLHDQAAAVAGWASGAVVQIATLTPPALERDPPTGPGVTP